MSFFHALLSQPGGGYYVSSAGGGGELTLSEFEALYPSIPAGSSVFFKRGDVFDFALTVDKATTFDAFGSGNLPRLRGSIDISGQTWTNESGNLWYTTMAREPKGLTILGTRTKQAQSGWVVITARPSRTEITASTAVLNPLNTTESLVGASIVAKEFSFRPTFARTVTAYNTSTGVITINAEFDDNDYPAAQMPFKLFNHKGFASAEGDWAYYSGTSRLYVYSTVDPSTLTIRAIVEDYGFNISSGVDDVQIKNLDIKDYALESIYSVSNDNLVISGCTIRESMLNGISVRGNSSNVTITNNTIYKCAGNGIQIGGITNSLITLNTIYNIGYDTSGVLSIPYYTDLFRSVGCAIHSRWDVLVNPSVMTNTTVSYNDIDDVGYCGITFVGTGNTFHRNNILNFCMKWSDGGGIYCSNRPFGTGYATDNCTISENIIQNGIGSVEGIGGSPAGYAEGVYIDNGSSFITIDGNQIKNILDCGILVNFDTNSCTVVNNIVSDCDLAAMSFRKGYTGASIWPPLFANGNASNVCEDNIFVSSTASSWCIEFYTGDNDGSYTAYSAGGSGDNNVYISPYRQNIARHFALTSTPYSLAGWRTFLGHDINSSEIANHLLYINEASSGSEIIHTINGTASPVNTTPGTNYMKVDKTQAGTESVPAYDGLVFVKKLLVEDSFTGSSGNITGHTPEIGGTYVVPVGTISLDGSGRIGASVTGEVYQDVGKADITLETIGRVSALNNPLNILLRYTDTNNYVQVQVLINNTSSQVNLINRVSGSSTTISSVAGPTMAANTDYIVKVKIVGTGLNVSVSNITYLSSTSGAWTTNNPTGTKHGLRVATTATYNEFKIAEN